MSDEEAIADMARRFDALTKAWTDYAAAGGLKAAATRREDDDAEDRFA